jgi:hypothetical protein
MWDTSDKMDKKTAILIGNLPPLLFFMINNLIGTVIGALFVVLLVLIIFRKPLLNRVQLFCGAKERKATLGSEDSMEL